MKSKFWIIPLVLVLFSCDGKEENKEKKKSNKGKVTAEVSEPKGEVNLDYFYPIQPKPLVYVYSLNNNPLTETFLKITTGNSKSGKIMMLETYNSDMVFVEGLTLDINNGLSVLNHSVASQGTKFESNITKKEFIPVNDKDTSAFIVDFPTENDSIVMLIERYQAYGDKYNLNIMDSISNCLEIKEFWRVTSMNVATRKENERSFDVSSFYAKGIGKVAYLPTGETDTMKLVRQISIEDWNTLVQQ